MRFLLVLGCGFTLFAGADPREIVRRSVELDARNSRTASNYTFVQRQQTREMDSSGGVKSTKIETFDISLIEGSPYRRLVARNDQPLSPEEQMREEEKLRQNNEERHNESREQRERRLAEWQRRRDRQHEPVQEIPDAFNFTLTGEEQLAGRSVYVIEANPRPGYKPKSQFASFFPRVRLHLWIDKEDSQGARVEMEVMDTISFGGFLVRLSKGSHMLIEQTRVNNEVWLPKHISLSASARLLLLKGLNREMDFTFSDYKKFQVDSRLVGN